MRASSLFFSSLLVLGGSVVAQQGPTRDPHAIRLLASSFVAMGGANLATVQDTEVHAQVSVPRNGGVSVLSVTLKTLGTRNLRIESTSADGTTLFIANGQAASMQAGPDAPQLLSRRTLTSAGIVHIPVLSILSDWSDPNVRIEYIGPEKLGTAVVEHIRITPPVSAGLTKEFESPCDIYIDSQSLLVLRLDYFLHPPGNPRSSLPVEVSYSDYRVVAGISVPFLVANRIRGQIVQQMTVTGISVNRGFQPIDFQPR